jgi:hypothetical protein
MSQPQSNALTNLRSAILQQQQNIPYLASRPRLESPERYQDDRTITPYLAVALSPISKGNGKDKVTVPRYLIMYSDVPDRIWVMNSHPTGINRPLADFSIYRFCLGGIIQPNKKPGEVEDKNKTILLEGIDGAVLFKALTGSYDVSLLIAQGYVSLDALELLFNGLKTGQVITHGVVNRALESGMTPTQANELGLHALAEQLRKGMYRAEIKTAPLKDAAIPSTIPSLEDIQNQNIPDTDNSTDSTELDASNATIDATTSLLDDVDSSGDDLDDDELDDELELLTRPLMPAM